MAARLASCWFVCGLWLFAVESSVAADRAPPHLVVILADDLGWGDVSCNNPDRGKLTTPHIDRIAAEGLRCTDAHSSSGVCSPSRYTLLTGRYHWRSRLQSGIVGYLDPPLIPADRLTLPRLLQQQGYYTACVGKWHLGWDWSIPPAQKELFAPARNARPMVTAEHRAAWQAVYSQPIQGGPITRGFDEYFGTDVPNWPPYAFIAQDRVQGMPSEFLPDQLLGNNLASLPGPALADWPLERVLPTLTDRACEFVRRRAAADAPFFLYLPLTTPHTPLSVNAEWQGRSGLGERAADLILETDAMVGRVLAALDETGVAQNTLVVFTSDNGFAPYAGAAALEKQGHFPSGPFRGYKSDAWEGGHRIPFLIRWPAVVQPGRVYDGLVHQADLLATLADLLHVDLPANAGEDSFSLRPVLEGSTAPVREHAVSHASSGLPALRQGNWKVIFGPAERRVRSGAPAAAVASEPAVQLYDLARDPGETRNLALDQPQRLEQLTALMEVIVENGRSTPGERQANDVRVNWRRFMAPPPTTE